MWRWMCLILTVVFLAGNAQAQPIVRASPRCEDGTLSTSTPFTNTYVGAANALILAGVAAKRIQIWRFWLLSDTATVAIRFEEGTGATCGTGNAVTTQNLYQYNAVNQSIDSEPLFPPLTTITNANSICLRASAAATISGVFWTCTVTP